jgi:hypothetical protein
MDEEPFPNATELFEQAVVSDDPLTAILGLLTQHPTGDAITELACAYTEVVESHPALGERLASVLAQIGDFQASPDAPVFPLREFLYRALGRIHFKCRDGSHEWSPKNAHLLESYLSGLSLKHQLTATTDMYHAVHLGLDATPETPYAQELVIGACIQLLLSGHHYTWEAGSYSRTPQVFAAKLKHQESSGVVKDMHAIHLLQVRSHRHTLTGTNELTTV